MQKAKRARVLGIVPPPAVAEGVAQLVRVHGISRAAEILGLSREATARIGCGATVRKGSIAVSQLQLAALSTATATGSEPPAAA